MFDDEELVLVHLIGDGEETFEELDKDVLRGVDTLVVLMAEHLDTGIDQENTEDPKNPLEPLDDGSTGKDEDTAQDQSAEDTPEKHFVLVFTLDTKEGEEHEENKQVIHRE